MTQTQDASGAGRPPQPPILPAPGSSFARRHPFYTAFGVLAGLSLFSAFWPVSAFVTLGLIGFRASRLDHVALNAAAHGAAWVRRRISGRDTPGPAPPQQPGPSHPAHRTPSNDLSVSRGSEQPAPPHASSQGLRSARARRARELAGVGGREPEVPGRGL